MIDKSTKKKTKNMVSNPAKLTKLKNTKSDKASVSQALPQAATLKERFKEGCIPLQTDFSDLIDLANIGRLAVGDSGPGWGLAKNNRQQLLWDPSIIYSRNFDLSPADNNDRVLIPTKYSGDNKIHEHISILAMDESYGPVDATNSLEGMLSTTYCLKATKIDAAGKKTDTVVKIIAQKAIGGTAGFVPFEYVSLGSSSYSLYVRFQIDLTDLDLNGCTLVISPLMLSVNYIEDYKKDKVGVPISLMNLHFSYNSPPIPKGLISMFSGSSTPAGWALCDGTHGTPDLRDRFVKGAQTVHPHADADKGGNKTITYTPSGNVTVKPFALTIDHMPKHSHQVFYVTNQFEGDNGGAYTTGGVTYQKEKDTGSTGGDKPHAHDASFSGNSAIIKIEPEYFSLAYIMKL